jgi:hypothetical protein
MQQIKFKIERVIFVAAFLGCAGVGDAFASDYSRLNLTTDNPAELLVTDSSGRMTGFEPVSQQQVQNIPQSAHFNDALNDDVSGQPATVRGHVVQIFQPAEGLYDITLLGVESGVYSLSINAFSQAGIRQLIEKQGVTVPGSTSRFQMNFRSTSGAPSTVMRLATFASTLADIDNSLGLGLIGNAGVANSLKQKIQAAQSANVQTRSKFLNAFENELNAQTGKHVTSVAAQMLFEDAGSLLSESQ